jgi:adenylate kinase|tara:strand:- start:264 stop:842 length:579 start_codon:yes stop_codon:yes gene_type:complete
MDTKKVIIVGIPGVGKTTIVDKVKKILHDKGVRTKYIVFGSVMMKEAEKIGVKDRDDMRKLSVAQQKKLQVAASNKISKMNTEVLLVDTHLFIKTNDSFWPGIPYDVATALSPTHIFLVIAQPGEIITRRLKDTSRRRDHVTEIEVLEELDISKNMLSCLAVMTGAAIMYIQNTEGNPDKAASIAAAALEVN